jgi:hypothetical protein
MELTPLLRNAFIFRGHRASLGLSLAVVLLSPGISTAQGLTCPQPAGSNEGCRSYHFHQAVWQPVIKGFSEVFSDGTFVSKEKCDTSRAAAEVADTALMERIRTDKIDNSFMATRFGECHCDRTLDPGSPVYLDNKGRTEQIRAKNEAHWYLLEKFVVRGAALSGPGDPRFRPHHVPREGLLSETLTANPTGVALVGGTSAINLKETTIGGSGNLPPIAAGLHLVEVTPPRGVIGGAQPGRLATPVPVGAAPSRFDPLPAGNASSPGDEFFQRELAAILAFEEDATGKSKAELVDELERRRLVLRRLRDIVQTSPPGAALRKRASAAVEESERHDFLRDLFGPAIASSWREASRPELIPIQGSPLVILLESPDTDLRRQAFHAVLADSKDLEISDILRIASAAETLIK